MEWRGFDQLEDRKIDIEESRGQIFYFQVVYYYTIRKKVQLFCKKC